MRQARLERLKVWIEKNLVVNDDQAMLSAGRYDAFEDMRGGFDVALNGLLQGGRNLRDIGYELHPAGPEELCAIEADGYRLTFRDAKVKATS